MLRTKDRSGLPLTHVLDATRGTEPGDVVWSAIAVLDDHDAALDTDEHQQRWRAWLHWSNLLQFLGHTAGDGVQLATSRAAAFPLETPARP